MATGISGPLRHGGRVPGALRQERKKIKSDELPEYIGNPYFLGNLRIYASTIHVMPACARAPGWPELRMRADSQSAPVPAIRWHTLDPRRADLR